MANFFCTMATKNSFLFEPDKWLTPNTYNRNFSQPPKEPGVYLLVVVNYDLLQKSASYDIVYVGSSYNLKQRYGRHEVLRFLSEIHDYVQFYFMVDENYKETEKQLIRQIQPKHNTQWR